MTPRTKEIVLDELKDDYRYAQGNLLQIQQPFAIYNDLGMQGEYCGSGMTRQAVLEEYEIRERELSAAIKEVEAL
jgi:hypothetical protein